MEGERAAKATWDYDLDTNVERFERYLARGDREGARHMLGKTFETVARIPTNQAVEGLNVFYQLAQQCLESGEVQLELRCWAACIENADQVLDAEDARSVTLRSNLAEAHRRAGNLPLALSLNEECLALRRNALGSDHPNVALSLNNLAQVHHAMGHAKIALELMNEALRIDRSAFGEQHDAVAGDLHNIGNSLGREGNYIAARTHYWSAIDIWKELHPGGHSHLAIAWSNLGGVYQKLGDMAAASLCMQQSVAIFHRVAGKSHPDTLNAEANLARLEPDKATQDLVDRLAVAEEKLGKQHPHLTLLRVKVAAAMKEGGEPLDMDAALTLLRDELGASHVETLQIAETRAAQLASDKDFTAAQAALEELIAAAELNVGVGPVDKARFYRKLAAIEAANDALTASLAHTRVAIEWFEQACAGLGPMAAEQDLGDLSHLGARLMGQIFSLWIDRLADSAEMAQLAWQFALRYKHLSTTLIERERKAARTDTRTEVRQRFAALRTLREQLDNELMVGPGSRGAIPAMDDIHRWQLEYRRQSAELAQVRSPTASVPATADSLQAAVEQDIPPDGGLIEYVRFHRVDFRTGPLAEPDFASDIFDSARYVAFLLRPGREVAWALVGSDDELQVLVKDFRRLVDPTSASADPGARSFKHVPVPNSWQEAAAALRSAVLDPLAGLWDCQRLLIAPDGVLANVPFEALPDPSGRTLIEERCLSYVNTARDLLRFAEPAEAEATQPVVIADPAYDCLDPARSITKETLTAFGIALSSSRVEEQLRYYPPLDGTRREGAETAALLGARLLTGVSACRGEVVALQSPRILHFATHGYYPDSPATDASIRFMTDVGDLTQPPKLYRDPTSSLQSGLLLTGANWKALLAEQLVALGGQCEANTVATVKRVQDVTAKAITHLLAQDDAALAPLKLPPAECGNGLVTAEDVSWLDLTGTELVVLSACGTGLGLYEPAQGLFGLRRSFFVAGARRLISSLWPVPDQETAFLMREFYALLQAGETAGAALQSAKLKLRAKYPDQPFCWAAFVLFGDPASIALTPQT